MIILSGASSVGKTTLANDWCEKHQEYEHIQEVARNIMKDKCITRATLVSYLQDSKEKFFDFQHLIFNEQNDREMELSKQKCSFIADRGPDPLAFVMLHLGHEFAQKLAESPVARMCLQRYRSQESLVIILCPLDKIEDDDFRMVPSSQEQLQYTNHLRKILDELNVPYTYCDKTDRYERIRWLEELVSGTSCF